MKTPKASLSRRDFLKGTAVAGTSLSPLLTSCTALDRLFMGQSGDNSDRVVVLGAGMAGLRAAYELRKKGVPYRIFEGSNRVGGRAWTLESLTPASQSGEIGCEWFSGDQTVFWDLAKELKLEIVEVKNQRDRLFLNRDASLLPMPVKDLIQIRDQARAAEGLSNDRSFLIRRVESWKSRQQEQKPRSLLEWAAQFSSDVAWKELIEDWARFHFAVSAVEVRSTAFAKTFLFSENVLDTWAGDRFRFRGGSSSLASAMVDRLMGAIPGDRLRLAHRLIGVEKLSPGYELHFETPEGRRRVRALHVICALPWATLARVEGLEEFVPAPILQKPVVSHQAKAVLTFNDRFWRRKWDQGRLLGPEPIWESTYKVQEWLENSWGLLTRVWSDEKALKAGDVLIEQTLQHLQAIEKSGALPLVESHLQNWSKSKWALARGAYPSLAKTEQFFEKKSDTWVWAGEHASGEAAGTWAGALESGARAAAAVSLEFKP
jgi:monoamine oxidase